METNNELGLKDTQIARIQNIEGIQFGVLILGGIGGLIYAKKSNNGNIGGFWRGAGYWILGGLILAVPTAIIVTPIKNKILKENDSTTTDVKEDLSVDGVLYSIKKGDKKLISDIQKLLPEIKKNAPNYPTIEHVKSAIYKIWNSKEINKSPKNFLDVYGIKVSSINDVQLYVEKINQVDYFKQQQFVEDIKKWLIWVKKSYPKSSSREQVQHAIWQIWISGSVNRKPENIAKLYGIKIKSYDELFAYFDKNLNNA